LQRAAQQFTTATLECVTASGGRKLQCPLLDAVYRFDVGRNGNATQRTPPAVQQPANICQAALEHRIRRPHRHVREKINMSRSEIRRNRRAAAVSERGPRTKRLFTLVRLQVHACNSRQHREQAGFGHIRRRGSGRAAIFLA
jgi:hypothetical protein